MHVEILTPNSSDCQISVSTLDSRSIVTNSVRKAYRRRTVKTGGDADGLFPTTLDCLCSDQLTTRESGFGEISFRETAALAVAYNTRRMKLIMRCAPVVEYNLQPAQRATQWPRDARRCGAYIARRPVPEYNDHYIDVVRNNWVDMTTMPARLLRAETTASLTAPCIRPASPWRSSSVAESILNRSIRLYLLAACLLYTSPSPRDGLLSRMPSSA